MHKKVNSVPIFCKFHDSIDKKIVILLLFELKNKNSNQINETKPINLFKTTKISKTG